MELCLVKLFVNLAFLISLSHAALPSHMKICPRSTPRVSECVKNSLDALRPYLKTGKIGPGFSVVAIEPMNVGDFSINRGFVMDVFDWEAFGMTAFKIEKIRATLDPFKIEMVLFVPKFSSTSTYKLKWNIGLLNIQGKGGSSSEINDVKVVLKIAGSKYRNGTKNFLKLDDVKLKLKPGSMTVNFSNLFNGLTALENVANGLINQNIDMFARDILPQVERSMADKLKIFANQFLSHGTYEEFLPEK